MPDFYCFLNYGALSSHRHFGVAYAKQLIYMKIMYLRFRREIYQRECLADTGLSIGNVLHHGSLELCVSRRFFNIYMAMDLQSTCM